MVSRCCVSSQVLINITTKFSVLLTIFNFFLSAFLMLTWKQVTTVEPLQQTVSSKRRKIENYFHSAQSTWRRDEFPQQIRAPYLLDIDEVKSIVPRVPLIQYPFPHAPSQKRPWKVKPEERSWLARISKNILEKPKLPEGAETVNEHLLINHIHTDPSDVYFSVRTTSSNHKSRLSMMIDTWISMVSEQVKIVTDADDEFIRSQVRKLGDRQPKIILADCSTYSHSKWSLLCKTYWEFKHFMFPHVKKKWFCHFDDDSYVNVISLLNMLNDFDPSTPVYIGRSPSQTTITRVYESKDGSNKPQYIARREGNQSDVSYLAAFNFALGGAGYCMSKALTDKLVPYFEGPTIIRTAASISLPDDCVIGFIITHLLNISLVNSQVMHSHLEDFSNLSFEDFFSQVTFPANSKTLPSVNRRKASPNMPLPTEKLRSSEDAQEVTPDNIADTLDYEFILNFHNTLLKSIKV